MSRAKCRCSEAASASVAFATRYDKRDDNYIASVKLASIRIWMRFDESVT
jgi:hypothetical protein